MSDAAVAEARRRLAAMRGSLEGLRQHQARLEAVCRQAQDKEAKLKMQLEELLVEAEKVKPRREDIESLFYSDEGWGTWEQDFRRVWSANAKAASSLPRQLRPLQASMLLPSYQRNGAFLCSESPLAAFLPDFASAEECAKLIELGFRTCRRHNEDAQEMQRTGEASTEVLRGVATASLEVSRLSGVDKDLMLEMQQRVATLTGIPIHGQEINPFLKFDQPAAGQAGHVPDDLSIGLHLDVNGGFPHCVCSVILYLNEVDSGGRTVFPCAETPNMPAEEEARCRAVGEVLAGAGHTHTSHSAAAEALGEQAAELVRRANGSLAGLRVVPTRGAALCFFTLRAKGGESGENFGPDPASWHGGAAVTGRMGKWTLQIFKEVPISHRCGGPSEEARYIESLRQRFLQAATSVAASD
ncbi:P4H10 [Symbiodinium sp. CCMP2592]|nr:P4H10 [Symbiodinium sp. CCMP2592]